MILLISSCDSPIGNLEEPATQPSSLNDTALPQTPFSLQAVQPDSVRTAAWRQFKAQHGGKWRIRWNEHTGLPRSIFGATTQKSYKGNAEQAARAFLADQLALFGIGNLNSLKHVKTRTNRGIRHVTFNQTVNGVSVYEAEYKVHLRPDGRVDMANGTWYPNLDISTSPGISKQQAVAAAKADLELQAGANPETSTELVIYRDGEQFRLAWKLVLFSEDPFLDWFYIVDAMSGNILYKLNQLMDVTGDGDVYPTHPVLSSVTNKPLYRLSGNGRLQGTYVYVVNDEASEAFSSNHSFQYDPSNTHFDEVSLYYHVDNFRHNFIENLNSNSLGFTQITAHAHSIDPIFGDLNAWFSRSTGEIYFGDASSSSNFNDFAKEDKVIHHEYGHAVIFDIQSGIMSEFNEEGAISEDTPDYFAGSFTGRSRILEYSAPSSERDMANPIYSYYSELPRDQNGNVNAPPHDGGEFFSAILWDLHNSVNPDNVDFLVYDALFRVTGDPDFFEFRDAMIAASNAAYGGLLNTAIQDAFANRGVGEPSQPSGFTVTINGPQSTYVGDNPIWTVDINDGTAPYSYSWQKKAEGEMFWTIVGTGSSYSETIDSTTDFELKVIVTDAEEQTAEDIIQVTVNDQIPAF